MLICAEHHDLGGETLSNSTMSDSIGSGRPQSTDTAASVVGQKRIALLIDTATSWGSGLIEGVADYAKARKRRWSFSFEPRGKYDRMSIPDGWQGDGVVARITYAELAEKLIASRIPAINVSWFRYGENIIPRCTCDEAAAAEMAARYFLSNGFRQFAYCGSTLRPGYYDRLREAFVRVLDESDYCCEVFTPDHADFVLLDYEQQLQKISTWLLELPKPTALLAFDDLQGRQITEACYLAGLSVPDDVAVLGGEHDELCSRISTPPLSSVDQNPVEVGYRAAEMLDLLMAGESLPKADVSLTPRRIIARQSTDKLAIDDPLLASALHYIRDNYAEDLHIGDILQAIPLSRRALEIGFRHYLDRTPREEIRRIRVQKAVELLCDTDWSVTKIATDCGFDRPELLTRAFRRELKSTPSEFRKRCKRKPSSR